MAHSDDGNAILSDKVARGVALDLDVADEGLVRKILPP